MENFLTHNEKEINVSGTSFVGYLNTAYSKLFEKLVNLLMMVIKLMLNG